MKKLYRTQEGICFLYMLIALLCSKTGCYAQGPRLAANAVSSRQIDLTWQVSFTPQASVIYRKEDNFGQQYVLIAQVGKSVLSYQDKAVEPSKTYLYYVRIVPSTKDDDSYTNEVKVTTPAALPATPGNLDALYISGRGLIVTWLGNNDDGTSFILERSDNGSGYAEIATVPYSRALSYADGNTVPGHRYCYRVKARNGSGDSGYSNGSCANTPQANPGAPDALIARSLDPTFQIQLNWIDRADNETGFEIERSTDNVNFSKIGNVGANVTQYNNTSLPASTRFYYRVRAVNAAGASAYSNVADATTNATPPGTPGNLSATAANAGQINLAWTDNASNESGFEIERSQDGVNFAKVADVDANTVAFQNTGLNPNTRYWYRIRARNNGGVSGYSNVAEATTPDIVPNAPQGLSATPVSNKQINLSWNDNSGNEAGFEVERSGDGTNFSKIADLPANSTSYESTGLTTLTHYWYRVRAKNTIGNSGYSNVADAVTLDVPPIAPNGLTAVTISSSQINLAWKDNSGNESTFYIEVSTDGTAFSKMGETAANATSYQATGLIPATRYWFRVQSRNAQGGSDYSNLADATTKDVPPHEPALLSADAVSYQQINLAWTDGSGNESGFEIEISTDGTNFTKAGNVAANVTVFQAAGLKELTRYYFRVRAMNAIGNSPYSNVASATTPKAPIPEKPRNLVATPVDFDLVRLNWATVSSNATTVIIERSLQPDAGFVQVGSQVAHNTEYSDREILDVADYYYRVKAVNAAGSSPYSDVAKLSAVAIITAAEPVASQGLVYASGKMLHIRLKQPGAAKMTFYDLSGAQRKANMIQQNSETDLHQFPAGIYLVVIETGKVVVSQKIILF